ncbi:hypothetical protein BDP27DRAFT_1362231 [Rhodocollybia butyracea]|uniref:Uncharacterized protein n=1 Tax=Rhodocollybia butyracea TaxID=206335 RepID=A0A9P5PW16_9AGAR|nr:hypothetical protein BDP27DRAFT_1362231 [Rhodocollybia butyracea]
MLGDVGAYPDAGLKGGLVGERGQSWVWLTVANCKVIIRVFLSRLVSCTGLGITIALVAVSMCSLSQQILVVPTVVSGIVTIQSDTKPARILEVPRDINTRFGMSTGGGVTQGGHHYDD